MLIMRPPLGMDGCSACGDEGRADVDGHGALVVVQAGLRQIAGYEHAGVIDQHVDRPQLIQRAFGGAAQRSASAASAWMASALPPPAWISATNSPALPPTMR